MNMPGSPLTLFVAAALFCLGAGPSDEPQYLQQLDQAVEDVNLLSESLRILQLDLRQPLGFSSVYEIPGHSDWLMRQSGELYAVSPQSAYARTQAGTLAIVPADTIFYIGRCSLERLGMGRDQLAAAGGIDAPPKAVRYEPRLDPRISGEPMLAGDRLSQASRPLGSDSPASTAAGGRSMEQPIANRPLARRLDLGGEAVEVEYRPDLMAPRQRPSTIRDNPLPSIEAGIPGTIEGDPEYRAERVQELMQRAARGEITRASSGHVKQATQPSDDRHHHQNSPDN